jgi:uncharacterized protein YdhG (YjbR/CyaY superfamily)
MSAKVKPTTVGQYIAGFPPRVQERLSELREYIRELAPGAIEELKWGMPAYSLGNILVMFGGFRQHTGFFPGTSSMDAFREELVNFKTANASIQFPHDQPLPKALIRKIVKHRLKEDRDGTLRWRT